VAHHLPAVAPGPALYDFLRDHLDPGGRLTTSDLELPDEPASGNDRIRWAAGAFDGAFGHHGGGGQEAERARSLLGVLLKAADRPTKRRLRKLYAEVSQADVLSVVDALLDGLTSSSADVAAVRDIGLWLATRSPDRSAVKVGLALLGAAGLEQHVDVVRALGAHDEFTLYAAVALMNGLADPDSELWALAASVDGWGRIQCVERLRDTQDPKIKQWILREGYRNSIMYEYLALIAAQTGGLLAALEAPDVDRGVLTSAGEIIEALIAGGPAEDMDDYPDGADAVERYLSLMQQRSETLGDFGAVAAVRAYVSEFDEARSQPGWTPERCAAMTAACDEILARDAWNDRIAVGLMSEDSAEFWRAQQAARHRGIDIFAVHLGRISAGAPGASWFHAWQLADRDRAVQLVDLARQLIPLEEVGSGPADELGLGPGFEAHRDLDWTLQALRSHIGVGGDLLMVGLRSPVVRNRNMAMMALQHWPENEWPEGARALVEELSRRDPNEKAREFAHEVLDGGPP
jgi:hypothetical protein